MSEFIEVGDHLYVRADASPADKQTKVLMSGDLFAVFDRRGDFRPTVSKEQGLFYKEMRHLSRLILRLEEGALLLLSSAVRFDNATLAVDLTNAELRRADRKNLPGILHFCRTSYLWENICYHRMEIRNYAVETITVELILEFATDFADIFEVRGHRRQRAGQLFEPRVEGQAVALEYLGLDGLRRETRIELSGTSAAVTGSEMRVPVRLAPGEQTEVNLRVQCISGDELRVSFSEREAADQLAIRGAELARFEINTSNEKFNDWMNRSVADLRMLIAATPEGIYPYAGVPWFSTIFGRDGIITALQCLWACPEVAHGVLSLLASTQATAVDPVQDAEPGKILHEARQSEMAVLGEVPFRRYYGSVDSTPLFILLAAAYFKRTGDRELIARLWPNIESALHWIDHYGDRDGDGFIEYERLTPHGLLHQGWKDSPEPVFHADGTIAPGPVALCEVQGYVYAAKRGMADLMIALGQSEKAKELYREAELLKKRFDDAFWCEEISSYALALDGDKQSCRIRSSNAGHTLFTGIASDEHAGRIITELGSARYYSGWGIRTVATGEARYNPMAYHNGSVWPHDNALIAYGLTGAKDKTLAGQILTGLLDASNFFESHRLPELFCGFAKRPGEPPTLYPTACSPQAWAAGAVFMVLQACLGMEIRAIDRVICFIHPGLPESMPEIRIRDLRVGSAVVDLSFKTHQQGVSVLVTRRVGDVEIITVQ